MTALVGVGLAAGALWWGSQADLGLDSVAALLPPDLRAEECALTTADGGSTTLEPAAAASAMSAAVNGQAYSVAPAGASAAVSVDIDPAVEQGVTCTLRVPRGLPAQSVTASGLTPRAEAVRQAVAEEFGTIPVGGFAPGGVTSGHGPVSKHYDGLAVDFFFRPYEDPAQQRLGWTVVNWLVAHAEQFDIEVLIYDDKIWSTNRSPQGWRQYSHPQGQTDPINRHLDHIHMDVYPGG